MITFYPIQEWNLIYIIYRAFSWNGAFQSYRVSQVQGLHHFRKSQISYWRDNEKAKQCLWVLIRTLCAENLIVSFFIDKHGFDLLIFTFPTVFSVITFWSSSVSVSTHTTSACKFLACMQMPATCHETSGQGLGLWKLTWNAKCILYFNFNWAVF